MAWAAKNAAEMGPDTKPANKTEGRGDKQARGSEPALWAVMMERRELEGACVLTELFVSRKSESERVTVSVCKTTRGLTQYSLKSLVVRGACASYN